MTTPHNRSMPSIVTFNHHHSLPNSPSWLSSPSKVSYMFLTSYIRCYNSFSKLLGPKNANATRPRHTVLLTDVIHGYGLTLTGFNWEQGNHSCEGEALAEGDPRGAVAERVAVLATRLRLSYSFFHHQLTLCMACMTHR
jgi:hypothetical protein